MCFGEVNRLRKRNVCTPTVGTTVLVPLQFFLVEPLTLPPSEPREDGESAGGQGGSDDPSQPFRGRGHSGHGAPPEGGIRAAQGPGRAQEAQA